MFDEIALGYALATATSPARKQSAIARMPSVVFRRDPSQPVDCHHLLSARVNERFFRERGSSLVIRVGCESFEWMRSLHEAVSWRRLE